MTPPPASRARGLLALLVPLAILLGACAGDDPAEPEGDTATTGPGDAADPNTSGTSEPAAEPAVDLPLVQVAQGERPHFADQAGREVLLRGVNVIHLGDYFQADPAIPEAVDVTADDWSEMAAVGFDSVRLVLSWSALEPERGTLDGEYITRIHEAVDQAEANGLYVILDMHQDAWSRYIATPEGTECPEGLEPAIGWDGAPEWATITDGAETCRQPGQRESSLAVRTAFQSFYDNRDGIRTALTETWGRLAAEFADEPAVVGYDLLNEPNGVEALEVLQPKYTTFVQETIEAIRDGEADAGGFEHIVFVEPIVLFPLANSVPAAGFTTDPNVAFAPHNYWESIQDILTIEDGFELNNRAAAELGMPYWIGEYGWWDTGEESLEELRRHAAAEDANLVGGAWWQWRQSCGDPHSIGTYGNVPDDQTHLNALGCPDNEDLGLTVQFQLVIGRAYPRAAPGELTELVSDPDAGTMHLRGSAGAGDPEAPLVVWAPGDTEPTVGGENIADIEIQPTNGGFYVRATAGCDYTLELNGAAEVTGDPSAC